MKRRRKHDPDAYERPAPRSPVQGLEQVLEWASTNGSNARELVRDRSRARMPEGLTLTPTEAAILDSATAEQLRDLVAQLRARVLRRRQFLHRAAAASAAALTTGLVAQAGLGCRRDAATRRAADADESPSEGRGKPDDLSRFVGPYVMPDPRGKLQQPDKLRGPYVMAEGGTGTRRDRIQGPRVMPDPHIARQRALRDGPAPSEGLESSEDPDGG